jgi:polysaccharide pyruvyl transferase WcaK-like protein
VNVALFGLFGVGNYGNEASLAAALRVLRASPQLQDSLCICAEPAEVFAEHRIRAIAMRWPPGIKTDRSFVHRLFRALFMRAPLEVAGWFRAVWHLRRTDLFIVPGTGVLDDFCDGPLGMPYYLLKWCAAARTAGAKVLFVSVGAGPIHHPLSRILMKAAARLATYRTYRDSGSKDFMRALGVPQDDGTYPDLVFSLPVQHNTRTSGGAAVQMVAVGIMAYHGWSGGGREIHRKYLESMVDFVRWLLECGYAVRILTGDQVDDEAVQDFVSLLERTITIPDGRFSASPARSFLEIRDQMEPADLVIATRYHNLVCALMLRKPVISVGYSRKNDLLMADMGLKDFCQHIERLDIDLLMRDFDRVAADLSVWRDRIAAGNMKYRKRLDEQFIRLFGISSPAESTPHTGPVVRTAL